MKAVAEGLQLHEEVWEITGCKISHRFLQAEEAMQGSCSHRKINCSLHVVSGLTYIKVILIVNLFLFLKERVGYLLQYPPALGKGYLLCFPIYARQKN